LTGDPKKSAAALYVVVNGVELGGGSIPYSQTGRSEDGVRASAPDYAGGNEVAVRLPAGIVQSTVPHPRRIALGSTVFARSLRHASIRDVIAFRRQPKGAT